MVVLPTMSIYGLTKNKIIMAEKILLYFLVSDYSQSSSFYGEISSFKYIFNSYRTDLDRLAYETQEVLIELYKKYFNEVSVEVDIEEVNLNNANKKYQLSVSIKLEDNIYVSKKIFLNNKGYVDFMSYIKVN